MARTQAKAKGSGFADYGAIKSEIKAGRIRDLYVLIGEEDFLIDNLVDAIQNRILNPMSADLDRVRFDIQGQSSRLDLDQLKAELLTPPFLSERKLILVRNSGLFSMTAAAGAGDSESGSPKERQRELQQCLEQVTEQVCLVFVEQKFDKRLKNLLQLVQLKGIVAEMKTEQPRRLRQWIESEFVKKGYQIDAAAAESLADRCEHGMRVIWSELNKIFLFMEYTGLSVIGMREIALLSLPDLRGNVFELTEAISNGNTGRAMQLLDNLIRQKQPVQLIQFMLARHFRQLICAAELGQADRLVSRLKVMPFVASRLVQQARSFSIPIMERIYELCLESDLLVKTGKMGDRLALEILLIRSGEAAAFSKQH